MVSHYCRISSRVLLLFGVLGNSLCIDGMKAEAIPLGKPRLRVSPILEKLTSEILKDLSNEVTDIAEIAVLDMGEQDFLVEVNQVLRSMLSFEYLSRKVTAESNLMRFANRLKIKLRILNDEPFLREYIILRNFISKIKPDLIDVLKNVSMTAADFCARSIAQKNRALSQLEKGVSAICFQLESLYQRIDQEIRNYSDDLLDEVRSKCGPLRDFSSAKRAYNECLLALDAEKANPLAAYSTGKNTKAAALTLRKNKALAALENRKKELEAPLAKLEKVFASSKVELCECLSMLDKKMLYLHHHVACKDMQLCRIPSDTIIDIFFNSGIEGDGPPAELVRHALHELPTSLPDCFIPENISVRTKLLMILQRYICEACTEEKKGSVKGRIWEIAVALYLHRKGLLTNISVDLSAEGEDFARELDFVLGKWKICGDSKALNWEKHCPKSALESPGDNDTLRQILNQKEICDKRGAFYVVISRKRMPDYLDIWLKERAISFIDGYTRDLSLSLGSDKTVNVNFDDLHKSPYYFKY